MKDNNENRWWNIFTTEGTSKEDYSCPVLPMSAGRTLHKSLVNLYCPCRSDSTALECQSLLI